MKTFIKSLIVVTACMAVVWMTGCSEPQTDEAAEQPAMAEQAEEAAEAAE